MKILIVAPSYVMFPIGLGYVSSCLKRAGHEVDCYTFRRAKGYVMQLQKGYDLVATGGLCCHYANLKIIADLTKKLGRPLVVGGGVITATPELMSRALGVDYAVVGEGEETIVELLATIERGGDPSHVKGIGYFQNGQFLLTEKRPEIRNLDALPLPDYEGFDYGKFLDAANPGQQYYWDLFDHPREYPIVTSRSCPFPCTFCYHPIGKKYRQRSMDSVMEELQRAIPQYRINIVSIYDELFSYNEQRVSEFCKRFRELKSSIPWDVKWLCQMRVTGLNERMLDEMRESGCFMISYGFESYSTTVLESMKKRISPDEIHRAVHLTLDKKMSIQANFIFGDKAETLETARTTLDFWEGHLESGVQFTDLIVCPNSEIYKYSVGKQLIKDELDFVENHLFDPINITSMSNRQYWEMQVLKFKRLHGNTRYIVRAERSSDGVTVKCPHCEATVTYGGLALPKYFYRKTMYCRACRHRFFIADRVHEWMMAIATRAITPSAYRVVRKMKALRHQFQYSTFKKLDRWRGRLEISRLSRRQVVPLRSDPQDGRSQ